MEVLRIFILLLAAVVCIQDECLAYPSQKNKNKIKDEGSSLRFSSNTVVTVLNVGLQLSAKIDCSVDNAQDVQFSLFYTPALSQPPEQRHVQGDKVSFENGVYSIKNIQMTDYGHYICSAQRNQQKIMKNITLTPLGGDSVGKPIITPRHVDISSGDDLKLTCSCWNEKCVLKWIVYEHYGGPFKEHIFYENNVITNDQYSKRESILMIKSLTKPLNISCMSEYEGTKSEEKIEVWKVPTIKKLPHMVSVREGGVIEIECVAMGLPQPRIMWTKDSIITDCGQNDKQCEQKGFNYRISGKYDQKLKILKANKEFNAGIYGCHALNRYNMAEEQTEVQVGSENS